VVWEQWHRELKKVVKQKVSLFRQTAANFQQDIIGAQNFNFGPKFPQNGGFSTKYCIFGQKFSNEKKIFQQTKFRGCPWPPCHCLGGAYYAVSFVNIWTP